MKKTPKTLWKGGEGGETQGSSRKLEEEKSFEFFKIWTTKSELGRFQSVFPNFVAKVQCLSGIYASIWWPAGNR